MLTEVIVVISPEPDNGVVPQVQVVHGIEDLSGLGVHERRASTVGALELASISNAHDSFTSGARLG